MVDFKNFVKLFVNSLFENIHLYLFQLFVNHLELIRSL